MNQSVAPSSLVTLHYRISTPGGQVLVSTFESTPATLQLGKGEMMPALENCLVGLAVAEKMVFALEPEQAFGEYNPNLVDRVPLDALPPDGSVEPSTVIEFSAPDGSKFVGLVRDIEGAFAVMDFNHPLAGKPIRFEVEIIGIL